MWVLDGMKNILLNIFNVYIWQNKVMSEAEQHNDLVVEDFQESYLNLTVKTTYLLKWLNSSDCSRARFILKVDDDVNKRYWQVQTENQEKLF